MTIAFNDLVLLIILTSVHIVAIVFGWKVGKVFNSKSWAFVILGFIILLFKRLISFLVLFGVTSYENVLVDLLDRVYLPLIFWILIAIGMMRIYYKISSSIALEKKLTRLSKKDEDKKRK